MTNNRFPHALQSKNYDITRIGLIGTGFSIETVTELLAEQQAQIKALESQVAALKALVCTDHPTAEMCK